MPKLTLDLVEDYDFTLFGIVCHSKEYRLAFEFNKHLGFDFVREQDFELKIKGETSSFAFFSHLDEEDHLEYYLIANKGSYGKLVPEEKIADYLLVVKSDLSTQEEKEVLRKVSEVKPVLKAYQIMVGNLKSKRNLIF